MVGIVAQFFELGRVLMFIWRMPDLRSVIATATKRSRSSSARFRLGSWCIFWSTSSSSIARSQLHVRRMPVKSFFLWPDPREQPRFLLQIITYALSDCFVVLAFTIYSSLRKDRPFWIWMTAFEVDALLLPQWMDGLWTLSWHSRKQSLISFVDGHCPHKLFKNLIINLSTIK